MIVMLLLETYIKFYTMEAERYDLTCWESKLKTFESFELKFSAN